MKILVFTGILNFQIYLGKNLIRMPIHCIDIDLIEKALEAVSFQTNTWESSIKLFGDPLVHVIVNIVNITPLVFHI
jgi:hypothetical protein